MSKQLDKYSRQTNRRLVIGFVLILLLVGDGLVFLIYGKAAAISGLICIGGGMVPIILIWGTLQIIEMIAKRSRVDEID